MKLSILIPAREEERVISTTVCHLKKSLGKDTEVIVADGKSSDKTVEVARAVADAVVIYTDDKTHTASRGRNDAARIAHGEFFCFIDADTHIPEPKAFFERALKNFDNPKIVGVCGPQRAHQKIETWADRVSFGLLNTSFFVYNNILGTGEASGKFMLVRRSAFEKIGGFREDLATREDGDFFKRLSKVGKTKYDASLMISHGARRAHRIGWWRLWPIWMWNTLHVALLDRAHHKEWKPLR